MSNYLAAFFIFPVLAIPLTIIWLCLKPQWLQSVGYLPDNRLFFILYAAIAWIICILIIIMGYDWEHQTTISEQLAAGLGCLAFSFGFIFIFKKWLIREK